MFGITQSHTKFQWCWSICYLNNNHLLEKNKIIPLNIAELLRKFPYKVYKSVQSSWALGEGLGLLGSRCLSDLSCGSSKLHSKYTVGLKMMNKLKINKATVLNFKYVSVSRWSCYFYHGNPNKEAKLITMHV